MELRDGDICLERFHPEYVSERYVGWLNDPAVMGQTETRDGGHPMDSARVYVAASLSADRCRLWRIVHDEIGHVGREMGDLR